MKRVTAGYGRSFGEGSVLPVHQKPEDLNLANSSFHSEHLQAELSGQKNQILHEKQHLPGPLR